MKAFLVYLVDSHQVVFFMKNTKIIMDLFSHVFIYRDKVINTKSKSKIIKVSTKMLNIVYDRNTPAENTK